MRKSCSEPVNPDLSSLNVKLLTAVLMVYGLCFVGTNTGINPGLPRRTALTAPAIHAPNPQFHHGSIHVNCCCGFVNYVRYFLNDSNP
jgi:hypothetical protein